MFFFGCLSMVGWLVGMGRAAYSLFYAMMIRCMIEFGGDCAEMLAAVSEGWRRGVPGVGDVARGWWWWWWWCEFDNRWVSMVVRGRARVRVRGERGVE